MYDANAKTPVGQVSSVQENRINTEVGKQISILESNLSILSGLVLMLEKRLNPVICPDGNNPCPAQEQETMRTPMGKSIQEINSGVLMISDNIRGLTDRVEV